jgi:hypothetical protein
MDYRWALQRDNNYLRGTLLDHFNWRSLFSGIEWNHILVMGSRSNASRNFGGLGLSSAVTAKE